MRLSALPVAVLASLLQTRAIADEAGTPPGQHAFLAVTVNAAGRRHKPIARYPVQTAGSAEFAYECAEAACADARKPDLNAYVLEVYAPEDIATTFDLPAFEPADGRPGYYLSAVTDLYYPEGYDDDDRDDAYRFHADELDAKHGVGGWRLVAAPFSFAAAA